MPTVDELRQTLLQKEQAEKAEAKRLKEKVLCAVVTFPTSMQKDLGISGFTMKLSELPEFLENEWANENYKKFTVEVISRTNKWIENLPEANI